MHTVYGWDISGRMHRKLAVVLVSGQKDWEAGVGRKLKFHCILSCTVKERRLLCLSH